MGGAELNLLRLLHGITELPHDVMWGSQRGMALKLNPFRGRTFCLVRIHLRRHVVWLSAHERMIGPGPSGTSKQCAERNLQRGCNAFKPLTPREHHPVTLEA